MDKALKVIFWLFMGSVFVMVVTHAKGFSTAAGTVFTGFNTMATTLTGANIKSGEQ